MYIFSMEFIFFKLNNGLNADQKQRNFEFKESMAV